MFLFSNCFLFSWLAAQDRQDVPCGPVVPGLIALAGAAAISSGWQDGSMRCRKPKQPHWTMTHDD